jgi:hypothetical protein
MKKIIVSAAVAAMALSTTASALEDIKVNGSAKLFYETNNNGDNELFNKDNASGEVAWKLGMTGKQGNVAFESEVSLGTTMGLEDTVVSSVRTDAVQEDLYVSKANFTAPIAPDTVLKFGRQELDTPLAFTEKWNALQNNFDAAVFVNSSVSDLTIIGAYVGQTNTHYASGNTTTGDPAERLNSQNFKADNQFSQMHGGAYALAGLYNNKAVAVNGWLYHINDVGEVNGALGTGLPALGANGSLGGANAIWLDASLTMGDMNVKGIVSSIMMSDSAYEDSIGYALSASYKVSGWTISAAGSSVDEDSTLAIANIATGFKKTKLPTAAVYLDGLAVAQPGATAAKLKAAGKVSDIGLVAQFVTCANDNGVLSAADEDAMELDLIATAKLGDFNIKGIIMHRDFENSDARQHIRLITSINF